MNKHCGWAFIDRTQSTSKQPQYEGWIMVVGLRANTGQITDPNGTDVDSC